jgi:hypothetical protein
MRKVLRRRCRNHQGLRGHLNGTRGARTALHRDAHLLQRNRKRTDAPDSPRSHVPLAARSDATPGLRLGSPPACNRAAIV